MIDTEKQHSILNTIATLASGEGKPSKTAKRERQLMLIGARIVLGNETPPHWVLNISAGSEDRLFAEVGK